MWGGPLNSSQFCALLQAFVIYFLEQFPISVRCRRSQNQKQRAAAATKGSATRFANGPKEREATLQTALGVTTQTRLAAAAFAFCAFRYPAGGRAIVGIFAESAPAGSKEREATPLVPPVAYTASKRRSTTRSAREMRRFCAETGRILRLRGGFA